MLWLIGLLLLQQSRDLFSSEAPVLLVKQRAIGQGQTRLPHDEVDGVVSRHVPEPGVNVAPAQVMAQRNVQALVE